jgi:hypothetical protein
MAMVEIGCSPSLLLLSEAVALFPLELQADDEVAVPPHTPQASFFAELPMVPSHPTPTWKTAMVVVPVWEHEHTTVCEVASYVVEVHTLHDADTYCWHCSVL